MKTTLKNGVVVDIINESQIVLPKGSAVATTTRANLPTFLMELRKTKTSVDPVSGATTTTEELVFKTKTAIVSFVYGYKVSSGEKLFNNAESVNTATEPKPQNEPVNNAESVVKTLTPKEVDKLAKNVITFCKDFAYEPDPRCLNTLKYCKDPTKHLINSMELIGYDDEIIKSVNEKVKSPEWKDLLSLLKRTKQTREPVNKRLTIFYGKPGTGKTTKAINYVKSLGVENPTRIVASSSADPDDLFTRYVPNATGGVELQLTELGEAMQKGEKIIIDEINFYSQVVLSRLQGVTDETAYIIDRKIRIEIKDGFEIIATMNLTTNFGKYPLPIALVSRANVIEKFETQDFSWIF